MGDMTPIDPPKLRPERCIGSDDPAAIILGRYIDPQLGVAWRIRYGGDKGVVILGPNGTGKGTGLLMPNLLQLENRSIVVVDPKGEAAAVTAQHRRKLGRVVILNPFGVLTDIPGYDDLKSEGFNPLARLDPSADSFITEAAQLADALITIDSKEAFFATSARDLMAWLIMRVAIEAKANGKAPTILRVRELMRGPHAEPARENDFTGIGLPALALEDVESGIPGLADKAGQFTNWNRTTQAILSTAQTQTACFIETQIARDMDRDSFDFAAIKREPVTVYLILPPLLLMHHAKWLRLVLTSAIQAVMRPRQPDEPKVLFMLDEFYALGHMEIIATVWSLVRGYGVQMMPVLQSIPQLKELYPQNWETFLGMAGAVVGFAANDQTTADWFSHRGGDTTRDAPSFNRSTSTSWGNGMRWDSYHEGGGTSTSTNVSPTRTTFITPHKLYGLRYGYMVGAFDGCSDLVPIYAGPYFRIRQCVERARRNPYYHG